MEHAKAIREGSKLLDKEMKGKSENKKKEIASHWKELNVKKRSVKKKLKKTSQMKNHWSDNL